MSKALLLLIFFLAVDVPCLVGYSMSLCSGLYSPLLYMYLRCALDHLHLPYSLGPSLNASISLTLVTRRHCTYALARQPICKFFICCTHVCMHTHMHSHIHTHTCTHTQTHTHTLSLSLLDGGSWRCHCQHHCGHVERFSRILVSSLIPTLLIFLT